LIKIKKYNTTFVYLKIQYLLGQVSLTVVSHLHVTCMCVHVSAILTLVENIYSFIISFI